MADFDLVLKGTVVLADRIVEGGHVAVHDGKVVHVGQGAMPAARERHDLSGALILPASMVSGALFNAVGTALSKSQSSSRAAGLLTLANTVGAMAGALLAGFGLLPVLGMERSFRCIAAMNSSVIRSG